ncbi:MAG: hypothetical protein HZB52_12775 [Chloroflexi bacterium]|nr:hypothetical protein [Chloroflexota bacterium]
MERLPPPASTPAAATQPEPNLTPEQRRLIILGFLASIVIAALAATAVYFMVQNPAVTTVIRDIFIIFLAIESMFIGFALVVLMVQMARLTNLLQHEIKPILESTNETINTVRGTAIFVSENIVEPVMKINSYIAALSKFFEFFDILGEKKK